MKKFLFLFMAVMAITSITYSCKSNYCDNQKSLFTIENATLEIPYDSMVSIKQCLNYLETTYCVEGQKAQPVIFFDTKKGMIVNSIGRNILTLGLEPTPCVGELEYDFNRILEINLDGNNILIEGRQTPLDSVGQYVYYQYLNYGKRKGFSKSPQGNGIWLISEMNRPITDFNPIINEIVKGYIETATLYSDTFFGKDICNLSREELVELKAKLQFHLALKYSDEVLPKLELTF